MAVGAVDAADTDAVVVAAAEKRMNIDARVYSRHCHYHYHYHYH